MKQHDGAPSILGYCTNVHPGASLSELLEQLMIFPPAVDKILHQTIPFGVGLWLSCQTANELMQKDRSERSFILKDKIQHRIYSINGFPFSDFHSKCVKEAVYYPDWSDQRRLDYTLNLIEIAKDVCRPGEDFSISTLPIGSRNIGLDESKIRAATQNLLTIAIQLIRVERETDQKIHLDLEPEPLCFLESSEDVIQYFNKYLIPIGITTFKKILGVTDEISRSLLLDKIRICHDICHSAVIFENFQATLKNYDSQGIKLGKVQLSSALEVKLIEGRFEPNFATDVEIKEVLYELKRDRYLHQVIGLLDLKRISFYDLPQAIHYWENTKVTGIFRIHYHVPIFLKSFRGLKTTQDTLIQTLKLLKQRQVPSAWEVETYTWNVMSGRSTEIGLSERIATELNWVQEQ